MSKTQTPKVANVPVPAEAVQEAAAAAIQAVKQQAADPGEKIWVYNSYSREFQKGNQRPPSGWLTGPASLQLLSAGYKRLQTIGSMHQLEKVEFVRAARQKGTRKIFIWPTNAEDPDAIPVTGYRHTAWINLISLLGPEKMTIETGTRERYPLKYPTEETPEGPALILDMTRTLDRRIRRRNPRQTAVSNPT